MDPTRKWAYRTIKRKGKPTPLVVEILSILVIGAVVRGIFWLVTGV